MSVWEVARKSQRSGGKTYLNSLRPAALGERRISPGPAFEFCHRQVLHASSHTASPMAAPTSGRPPGAGIARHVVSALFNRRESQNCAGEDISRAAGCPRDV